MRRLHPDNLRAAWWALRTARRTRRLLGAEGLEAALAPPAPPPLSPEAERGVRAVLRRGGESCLVRSIVLQAWEAAHGRRRDLIVGVTDPAGFRAHAWLDGDPLVHVDAGLEPSLLGLAGAGERVAAAGDHDPHDHRRFHELLRRPAPSYGGPQGGRPRRR
ncbi:MAG TPA: lasso peptide biosynthesis B2 protein [Solirubrobacterales bacterium]|nr:lasso peptide biosynthesis B2 protein [Solirubrobacterales bacterium]